MGVQKNVSFEPPQIGLQSPSYMPNFISDPESPDGSSSEKDIEKDIELDKNFEHEQAQWGQSQWQQRPKSTPWTSRPQSLKEKLKIRWYRDLVVDVFSILMPTPFLILVAIVLFMNEREVGDDTQKVLKTTIQGATTVFPIFFAGLVGRAAIKFATWKLEQGSTLGLLEQLVGSRTVISTITTQFRLRSFNMIGLGLVVLWMLSPIGSQAVLHILETPLVPTPSSAEVTYFNTRQQSYSAPTGPFWNSWYSGYTMQFGASLLAPAAVKMSPMDLWGNVKIPYYSSVVESSPVADSDGWTYLSGEAQPAYSSLFGIPTSGLLVGNTTFNMESSYVTLKCGNKTYSSRSNGGPNLIKETAISPKGPFLSNQEVDPKAPWAVGYKGPNLSALNGSFFKGDDSLQYVVPQSCPDCLPSSLVGENYEPGTLLYEEFDQLENVTSIFCTPSQEYIESSIFCSLTLNAKNCRVTAQRPSTLPHMPTTITPLSFRQVILGITALLPNSTPQQTLTSPIQFYIYDPLSTTGIIAGASSIGLRGIVPNEISPILTLPMDDFSTRFGQIINTYLYASMWNATPYITGAPFSGLIDHPVGGHAASFVPASPVDLVAMIRNRTSAFTVSGTRTTDIRIFRVSYPWIAVFLLSTLAMLFSAIVGVLFSRNTVVPDYLGYVSTLAKESPYVRMPNGGVNLDGMDRARLMKGLRVRLGNVDEGRGEVGKLAFARMEDTGVVRKDSFYV